MRAAGSWLGVLCRIKVFSITKQKKKKGFADYIKIWYPLCDVLLQFAEVMLPIKKCYCLPNLF